MVHTYLDEKAFALGKMTIAQQNDFARKNDIIQLTFAKVSPVTNRFIIRFAL